MQQDDRLPVDIQACLAALEAQYRAALGDRLVGIYVHGSLAMDCFNPASSDIDVLVVVRDALAVTTRQRLGQIHLALASACPRPIEISVVTQAVLRDFVYPTPFEFHYGDELRDDFASGKVDLTTPRKDPDLAAHFVIAKRYGITLFGEPAQQAFPVVPDADYLDSIARDTDWSYNNVMGGPDEGTCRVPVYAVLNFCRVLAFIEDRAVTSKRSGGEWALDRLPDPYHSVIDAARREYAQTGSAPPVSCRALKAFASFAHARIQVARLS